MAARLLLMVAEIVTTHIPGASHEGVEGREGEGGGEGRGCDGCPCACVWMNLSYPAGDGAEGRFHRGSRGRAGSKPVPRSPSSSLALPQAMTNSPEAKGPRVRQRLQEEGGERAGICAPAVIRGLGIRER